MGLQLARVTLLLTDDTVSSSNKIGSESASDLVNSTRWLAQLGHVYRDNPSTNEKVARGFIKFLCRKSVGFFSRAFLVFLMKESKKRR